MTKQLSTLQEVREYVQEDYWVTGQSSGKSGYENFHIDFEWNEILVKHLNQVFYLNGKSLDLGCAYGQVVAAMHKNEMDAYGIDISDYAINAGKKEYPPLFDRIIQGSCHELSAYCDSEFDFIYSNQVFEHIPHQYCDQLAEESFRVAKSGCVLWCGLVLDLNSDFQPQGFNPKDKDRTHINLRPRDWWDEKMIKAGWRLNHSDDKRFKNVKLNGYSFYEEYDWHSLCYRKE